VKQLLLAVFLLSRVLSAADGCAVVPRDQIVTIMGMTKNTSLNSIKLAPKATEGRACTYIGTAFDGNVIVMKFQSAAAAKDYLKTIRDGLDKKALKTTTEKFGLEDGFSFMNGMLAIKNVTLVRVNVSKHVEKGQGPVNLELSRKLMMQALYAL
jgi:hypothetical protein